jgi:hypothetical protein
MYFIRNIVHRRLGERKKLSQVLEKGRFGSFVRLSKYVRSSGFGKEFNSPDNFNTGG